ncbi:hypothetical protein [Streptomyces sp. PKU-EA00015]|uniref:hypothetical protein n=1 Tax=Streptomyces sp. PKU-EA00015 TaxID=2748326 RepID=UPI002811A336|nr:hypothetical protein [Streptomyces sp. PKU-EA00015]
MPHRPYLCPAAAAAGLLLLSGCASVTERESAASGAVERFEAALRSGQTGRACAVLAPGTVEELEDSAKTACPAALNDAEVPAGGAVERVDVYGRQARVVLRHDTLFLSVFPDGWRITAAGCRPRTGGLPYSCEVKGE